MRQLNQLSRSAVVSSLAFALTTSLTHSAGAFERQWRVGAGVGFATLSDSEIGPAVGLHGAYGLSDMFDANVELLGSRHDGSDGTDVLSASAGISYKIDVLQWVPYVGAFAGYYYFAGVPGPDGQDGSEFGASIGAGVDYLWSRGFAMGLQAREHASFSDGLSFPMFSMTLRAEHRWGY